jgi:hypothetical protein
MSSPPTERAPHSVAGVADAGRTPVYDPGYKPRTPRRGGIVVVMIVSLLAAGGMRQWASDWQQSAVPGQIVTSRAGLGSMNSFALALLLGGLRGPLVMFLWTTSEAQKNDRDLDDFDTKIEWIRMLQPEFDTVHMFQIWNKAYNISVMMASPATKYTTILSAIDYAQSVLAERPDDMNIFQSLGQVYGQKMSGESTQERPFYQRQFSLESMTDKARVRAYGPDQDFRRLGAKSFVFLDDDGNILPSLLVVTRPRPASLDPGKPWNDGAHLGYLQKYEPFPYGILPIAMAFNYDMASDAAMVSENQYPLQLSPLVTDSKPGLDLKQWSETESKYGIVLTGQAFGVDSDADPAAINGIPFNATVADPRALAEAEYRFGMSSRLAADAIVLYKKHLANPQYFVQAQNYASHLMDLSAIESLSKGDERFATYFTTNSDDARRNILEQARDAYDAAMLEYEKEVLEFYTEDEVGHAAFPAGYTHVNIRDLPDNQVNAVYEAVMREAGKLRYAPHAEDRSLYAIPIARAQMRLLAIHRALR